MFKYFFVLNIFFVIAFCTEELTDKEELPSWIKDNPGFLNPIEVDSIKNGSGSLSAEGQGNIGWKIFLNEKAGHGIEIEIKYLNLNPNLDEFLLVSPWPMESEFIEMELFTGTFTKPLKKLRIPNTKTFYILFSTSPNSQSKPKMALSYRRYGTSLELGPPPTDIPVKKETLYEIQLKGKSLNEFSVAEFLVKVKEGLRASARRYCMNHNIPFNENITREEMVRFHRISFCPFEWPERDICTSVEHSIFVSGLSRPGEEFILNYQLTAAHLKKMWEEDSLQELQELGLMVYELPAASSTVLYWSLIIGLMIISSLIGTLVFWKSNNIVPASSRRNSVASYEVKKAKKPKLRLAKHQQVPSFMYRSPMDGPINSETKTASDEVRLKQKADVDLKSDDSSSLPIKNYFGSILFGINRGYEEEEEEETPVELRTKPHMT